MHWISVSPSYTRVEQAAACSCCKVGGSETRLAREEIVDEGPPRLVARRQDYMESGCLTIGLS